MPERSPQRRPRPNTPTPSPQQQQQPRPQKVAVAKPPPLSPPKKLWTRDPVVWICVAAPVLGLLVIGADRVAVAGKRQTLAIKAEADQAFAAHQYEPAVSSYDRFLGKARGSRDYAIQRAIPEAEQNRATAADVLAKEEAARQKKAAEEQARYQAQLEQAKRTAEAAASVQSTETSSSDSSPSYRSLMSGSSSSTASGSEGSYRASTWSMPNTSARTTTRTEPRYDPPPTPSYSYSSPGYTATGIPLHTGPRGGVYHFSKSVSVRPSTDLTSQAA